MASLLVPPVGYQGSKRILAPAILDVIRPDLRAPFWDLCCGGAAVGLEAVRRGLAPRHLMLVDHGPWGEVWRDIGQGRFDLATFRELLADLPSEARQHDHLHWLARQPVTARTRPAVFLVLQAASFGGRAMRWEEGRWKPTNWRRPWTGVRKGRIEHAAIISPRPDLIRARVEALCEALEGMRGVHGDVRDVRPTAGVAYLDPPYRDMEHDYGASRFDALAYAQSLAIPCWISEARRLTPTAHRLHARYAYRGIHGGRQRPRDEWLSCAGAKSPRPARRNTVLRA